jgi:hypothetical protein
LRRAAGANTRVRRDQTSSDFRIPLARPFPEGGSSKIAPSPPPPAPRVVAVVVVVVGLPMHERSED